MIYFDGPTKAALIDRFAQQLTRWLALHRPFGIADRLASATRAGRPHDLSADTMTEAAPFAETSRSSMAKVRPAAGRRFFDAANAAWMVKVFPGEFYVTREPDEVLVTVLGSCVSACIRDPVAGIGGMNHFMLPQQDPAAGARTSTRRASAISRWRSSSTS